MTRALPLLRSIPVLLLLLLSACSTTYPRFHEQSKVDLAVHFVSWEAITVTRPRPIEKEFVTYCTRTDVEHHLASIKTGHQLAVVLFHYRLPPEQQAENQKTWSAIFTNLGFERVVFLQAKDSSRLNGSQVLNDMQLAQPTHAEVR
jgi:hypothetical protein